MPVSYTEPDNDFAKSSDFIGSLELKMYVYKLSAISKILKSAQYRRSGAPLALTSDLYPCIFFSAHAPERLRLGWAKQWNLFPSRGSIQ